ncbi:helix-turn-helix transcriptional regulator [Terrimonas sp. NA20]|uniref:Helix-turn-helix transcriptional regulator n=1 Tax=Terrimonas ginsenosidimutans TaxID=2908004 RepID=A0ABS9KRC1_9BACT|nr:helix-turn-helix transcriptional regulator [Terrimonas ginsenosidimutans]MCG2614877.1 helix-turn-helix transcriptional regulator [Terrimonas ginsenosidimutans]
MNKLKKSNKPAGEVDIDMYENFRLNVRLLRAQQGMSQKELSESLGFSSAKISFYECDRLRRTPKMADVYAIARFFGVDPQEILFKKGKVVLE